MTPLSDSEAATELRTRADALAADDRTGALREHTADCYARGCTSGSHPAPRPGHRTGGPWTPAEVLAADDRTGQR